MIDECGVYSFHFPSFEMIIFGYAKGTRCPWKCVLRLRSAGTECLFAFPNAKGNIGVVLRQPQNSVGKTHATFKMLQELHASNIFELLVVVVEHNLGMSVLKNTQAHAHKHHQQISTQTQ